MLLGERFAQLRSTVRNHPVVVASSAATVGVLLGGFIVVQLFAPPRPQSPGAGTAQAVAETKALPKPAPETTGSAPTAENVSSEECERQTWPNLSRLCMEELRARNRATRVVTTDKPAATGTEASQPAENAQLAAPALWAPSVTSPAPLVAAPPPVATASAPVAAAEPTPAAPAKPTVTATVAPAEPVAAAPAKPTITAAPAPAPAQAAVAAEARVPLAPVDATAEPKEKPKAKKAKRKPKPAKQELDGDDDRTVASAESDDDEPDRRSNRSRRIVDRWTERDYDVESESGGRRRVTVIRRNNGGGLFESLFGN
jgi:hypothetical protein